LDERVADRSLESTPRRVDDDERRAFEAFSRCVISSGGVDELDVFHTVSVRIGFGIDESGRRRLHTPRGSRLSGQRQSEQSHAAIEIDDFLELDRFGRKYFFNQLFQQKPVDLKETSHRGVILEISDRVHASRPSNPVPPMVLSCVLLGDNQSLQSPFPE
jgi:hypothetical protein